MGTTDTNTETKLMKGNEALAEAALRAGMQAYFGYPITPQSEILEYLIVHGPKRGAVILQAESEVAAINMVYGAAGAGARVMISSSSPGISLMQEGISYIAAAELPCVIVNVQRGGPGLGTIQPAQADYFQATKGGGHGDYRLIVLAPSSVQEMSDFMFEGFRLTERYRIPVMILSDGALGQMMEKVTMREDGSLPPTSKPWATTGKPSTRERNFITSLHIEPERMEKINLHLQAKYADVERAEAKCELIQTDDADVVLVAFGLSSRICQKVLELARAKGIRAGLVRPITLWPFPSAAIAGLAQKAGAFLTVEMNAGQMVEDVRLAVNGKKPVFFKGRMGGMIPTPEEVLAELESIVEHQLVHA
ncbi:MAG: 3-methyl-2-oxobutanoate dehydrogenase subunit VorB [Acidobacteriota bacterium]